MFSVPAKDWTKQTPTWSSHLSILNLRDWEVEALVANMLPIHDLVDMLLILCAEPKCPLLHGCMSLWCWYLLFVVMIELYCQMYWLSVYLQHIPYQYVQPKEEITLALFADTRRKPFQFAGSLAEGTTVYYSSYSCSSHIPGRFLQTIYLYRYTSQTRYILSTDCSCPFTYGMNVSSIYSWNIDIAIVGNILTTTVPSSIFASTWDIPFR